jgi:sec-independent protein translocase protein TatA
MLEGLSQPTHLLSLFGIVLVVFGGRKIPELGRGIGEGIRGFKSAMKDDEKLATTTTDIEKSD